MESNTGLEPGYIGLWNFSSEEGRKLERKEHFDVLLIKKKKKSRNQAKQILIHSSDPSDVTSMLLGAHIHLTPK